VSKSASRIVEEVRRQFHEILGLREGKASPDYNACIDIATSAALKQMILPGIMAIVAPLLVGFFLGGQALSGMLVGAIVCGVLLAMFMSNSGGAWDNAKKMIEEGDNDPDTHDKTASHYHTDRNKTLRRTHKAAVVGDTVGDPLKDTAGPAMNILIKLMCIVALLFAALFQNPIIR
jgi:K(+)-stimulated pyrophosphate-energized sodium pump